VKTGSPFPDTFIATLANGWHGYAPTLEAFNRGGYEPRFAYPSRLAPEAGDRMTDAALELLQRLASLGHGSQRRTTAPAPNSS
jgi:neutral ceramidase